MAKGPVQLKIPQARLRNLETRTNVTGDYFFRISNPQTLTRSLPSGVWGSCQDVVGNPEGVNALEIIRNYTKVPVLGGELWSGSPPVKQRGFYGFPVAGSLASTPNSTSKFPNPTQVELNNYAYAVKAATNPSKAHVSLPTFLAELKDLPGMLKYFRGLPSQIHKLYNGLKYLPLGLKTFGSSLIKAMAEGHIAVRWGINPLVSDLRKLLGWRAAMEKRLRLLYDLQKDKKVRTRMSLGSDSQQVKTANVFLHSEGDTWKATRLEKYTSKMWATCQWNTTGLTDIPALHNYGVLRTYLDPDVYHPSNPNHPGVVDTPPELKFVNELLYGLNVNSLETLATLWEITPWSWLADWFFGFGTVIQSLNNALYLTCTKSCLMRTTTVKVTYEITTPGTWSVMSETPEFQQVRKQRWPIATILPFAPTTWPLVEPKAWSILASLWVLNPKRRRRSGINDFIHGLS